MALVIDTVTETFDVSKMNKGTLVYAKHKTWQQGKGGFLIGLTEQELIVQYYPGLSGMTNHFYLPVKEVASGDWEIRWSDDLTEIQHFGGGDL